MLKTTYFMRERQMIRAESFMRLYCKQSLQCLSTRNKYNTVQNIC
ncbi:hypothetical protein AAZX31_19G195700 [Glycine max]